MAVVVCTQSHEGFFQRAFVMARLPAERNNLIWHVQSGLSELGLIRHTLRHPDLPHHVHLAHQILATLRAADPPALSPEDLTQGLQGKARVLASSLKWLHTHGEIEKETTGGTSRWRLTPRGLAHAEQLEDAMDHLFRKSLDLPPPLLRNIVEAIRTTIGELNRSDPEIFRVMCPHCTLFSSNAYPNAVSPHHCGFLDKPITLGPARQHRRRPS